MSFFISTYRGSRNLLKRLNGKKNFRIGVFLPALFALSASAFAAGSQQLSGYLLGQDTHAALVGDVPPNETIYLGISLPLQNKPLLDSTISSIYNRKSPQFRKFLKPAQIKQMFGASSADYQETVDFFKSKGFTVTSFKNNLFLSARGPVSVVQDTFHVHLRNYKRADGSLFHAPDAQPSVDLGVPLLYVSGLENHTRYRHSIHTDPSAATNPEFPPGPTPTNVPTPTGSCSIANPPICQYSFWGQDFRNAYGLHTSSLTGSGQNLDLVEFDGYNPGDISTYISQTSIPSPNPLLIPILINNFNGNAGPDNDEVCLDIEVAICMAPGMSTINVYEAPNGTADALLNQLQTNDDANQISCSWSIDDSPANAQVLEEIAAQGQGFFVASGDQGAYFYGVEAPNGTIQEVVSFPPIDISPWVTAVGGTMLTTSGNGGTWVKETTWNNPSMDMNASPTPSPIPINIQGTPAVEQASGGGVCNASPLTPTPTTMPGTPTPTPFPVLSIPTYQVGSTHTGLTEFSTTNRNVPDVSMVAYNIYAVFTNPVTTGVNSSSTPTIQYTPQTSTVVNGTSAAAPLWAAFMALVNEQANENGTAQVGFPNYDLYSIGNTSGAVDFHNIADGSTNNLYGTPQLFYTATSGFNLTTGWGTPNGSTLINDLVNLGPVQLNTPTTGNSPANATNIGETFPSTNCNN